MALIVLDREACSRLGLALAAAKSESVQMRAVLGPEAVRGDVLVSAVVLGAGV